MSTRAGEGYGDDDRLPWLETVEEDYREGPSVWRILLLVVLGLAVLASVSFAWWWYQRQQGVAGNGELIAAQEGDYKVKPDEPGGMKVEGEGGAAFKAGEGTLANASIEEGGPEVPVEGRRATQPAPGLVGAGKATVAVPPSGGQLKARVPAAPAAAAPGRSGAGALIQLGAFPDQQGADAAWARLSKRFAMLAPLGKSVERGEANGKTVYRLRVNAGSNGQAKDICEKIQAGGERCYVAN